MATGLQALSLQVTFCFWASFSGKNSPGCCCPETEARLSSQGFLLVSLQQQDSGVETGPGQASKAGIRSAGGWPGARNGRVSGQFQCYSKTHFLSFPTSVYQKDGMFGFHTVTRSDPGFTESGWSPQPTLLEKLKSQPSYQWIPRLRVPG